MLRKIGLSVAAILALGVVVLGGALGVAHSNIDAIDPPLPAVEQVLAVDLGADLPVSIRWIDTASQVMPRAAVLEPSVDPEPDLPYRMSHSAFVLEWSDGRLFVIDTGMSADAARAFGAPMEWAAGAEPMQPQRTLVDALGDAVGRVSGLGFTHLHTDHTEGVMALCAKRDQPVPLFQTPNQMDRTNYTTAPARSQLEEADCLRAERLAGDALAPVPGFPGLSVFAAAGHTPGSQVFVTHVRRGDEVASFALIGDVANHIDGIRRNLPKPELYSRFVVPEATERLDRVRQFLSNLERRGNVEVIVSHDQGQLAESGIEAW